VQRRSRAQHVSRVLVSVIETRRGWEWVRQIWALASVGRASTDGSSGSIPKERPGCKELKICGTPSPQQSPGERCKCRCRCRWVRLGLDSSEEENHVPDLPKQRQARGTRKRQARCACREGALRPYSTSHLQGGRLVCMYRKGCR
jgi:hypothetical protein